MSKLITIVASALLLGYLVTELATRFFAGDFFALLIASITALLINGFFVSRVSPANQPAPNNRAPKESNKRDNRDKREQGKRRSEKGDKNSNKSGSRDNNEQRKPKPAKPGGKGEQGTVKWFNRSKGYGFIVRENGDEIFVHQRSIVANGDQRSRPVLNDGQSVEFVVTENERGVQAEQVYPLD